MPCEFPLSIVIPIYNEEQVLPLLFSELEKLSREKLRSLQPIEIVFVNDGSDRAPSMALRTQFHSIELLMTSGANIMCDRCSTDSSIYAPMGRRGEASAKTCLPPTTLDLT